MTDEPARPPRCRTCIHWKRSTIATGICWQLERYHTPTGEDDTCERHEPKVIRVSNARY